MSLQELGVTNLRCIEHAQLQIASGLTLIWGENGSGKTSLLEGVFMLGRGRSFRSRNNDRLIRYGRDHLRVTGDVRRESGGLETLTFEVTHEGTTARVGARTVSSLAELSQEFPVQVIDPGVHRLVEEGGYRRRRWLDWAVFHVEPSFVSTWLRYTRTLKQRNAALRARTGEAAIWDPELARLGESIKDSRQRLVEELQPYWRDTVAALTGLDVELRHLWGWNLEHSLLESLAASRTRDELQHVTHAGPHRGDIALRLDGRHAREVLSRGQQKLVAAAMMVAQLKLLHGLTELRPTLLLDDPAAELDGERLERFIAQVASLKCQLVVTSLQPESRLFGTPDSTFRVERGRVQPV
jgi:DNA replication and repair protein RecF